MRNDDTAVGPAASPAGRSPLAQSFARRIQDWALHAPPWFYIALAVTGLAAALLVASLER
jgi:hypothetical protein